jgi:hypothetical protein
LSFVIRHCSVTATAATSALRDAAERARFVREHLPTAGLFADHDWRTSPEPYALGPPLAKEIESLGRVLLQFYRAVNLLYRKSVEGKQPEWVARWLDLGKPAELIQLQRSPALRNEVPRVIRPDLLITDQGLKVTELDSVPGGIGLTGWLNQTYSQMGADVLGGAEGMSRGFASIFGDAPTVHIIVSEEAGTYRPEMSWLAGQMGASRFKVQDAKFSAFSDGDAVYRFFEMFDVANVPNARQLFDLAVAKRIRLTPPPRPMFEEKMLFALLWNRHLHGFWRQELGESFLKRLLGLVPYTWIMDPAPLPPHAAIPELNLTDWRQLTELSHKERELILKVSGFSPHAWGARGVYLGSDLSQADWAAAVGDGLVEAQWFDFSGNQIVPMKGRVRLCPYYFVVGDSDGARAELGGVLATICPSDKKIIHGMTEAIFAPCSA